MGDADQRLPRRGGMTGSAGLLGAAAALSLVAVAVPGVQAHDPGAFAEATALTAIILGVAVAGGWQRLPRRAWSLPPLTYLGVVALLRDATGGGSSPLGWLALLPVIWLALHGSRRELAAAVAGVGVVFAAPILFTGPPAYPASEWSRVVAAMLVATAVGLSVQRLVDEARRQARVRRMQSAALVESEARTRAILAGAQDAFVAIDETGVITAFNPQAEALFGWPEAEAIGRDLAETIIPERYREAHRSGLARFVAGGEAQVLGRRLELAALHRDGREIPVELTISAVPTTRGHAFNAFLHDISERRLAEQLLRDGAQRMTTIVEATRALSRSTDPDVSRRAICEAACAVAGAPMALLMEPDGPDRLTLTSVVGIELAPYSIALGREPSGMGVAFLSREPYFVADTARSAAVSRRLVSSAGAASMLYHPILLGEQAVGVLAAAWAETRAQPPEGATAALALLAAHAAAAIERTDLLGQLGELARTDALTGLPNRRVWDEALPHEIERARRDGRPLSIAMLDMDDFSSYNAEHGHPGGDRLLADSAAAWRAALRTVDTVARCGGEEFGVILPGAPGDQALAVVQRTRRATPGPQTCSAGVARWDGRESAAQLVARADRALYAAKQAGRDRAVLA